MAAVAARGMWGTWEELVLGGAVLRHGTQAWDVVSSELRARTVFPCSFTPEACKARYEDLQERYSGCKALFEELRKRRVAELKQELVKAEDSIGSLELKLQSLKAEKGDHSQVGYGSSRTDSPVPLLKLERIELSGKETSKDGLSAGSFTQDIKTEWQPECQLQASESAAEIEIKQEVLEPPEREKFPRIKKLEEISRKQLITLRKRRGKRKRIDCSRELSGGTIDETENLDSTNVTSSRCMEDSISGSGQMSTSLGKIGLSRSSDADKSEAFTQKGKRRDCNKKKPGKDDVTKSENLGSATAASSSACKENSTSGCDQIIRSSRTDDPCRGSDAVKHDDLLVIFNSIAENENALVLQHRLDSQKGARYRRVIRQHMDFNIIKSRVARSSISSMKELFRDMLLVANNALAVYSRRMREFKCAVLLRDIITKAYQQHFKSSGNISASPFFLLSPLSNHPVKPRSLRPHKPKLPTEVPNVDNIVDLTSQEHKKSIYDEDVEKTPGRCKGPRVTGSGVAGSVQSCRKPCNSCLAQSCRKLGNAESGPSLESSMVAKQGFGGPVNVGRRRSVERPRAPTKERKKALET